jgi:hypothetical protein
LEAAPFLLQWDAFSCRDALDFNRTVTSIFSSDAPLQKTVDEQALIFAIFALDSPLAKRGNSSYSWQASTMTLHATCRVVIGEIFRLVLTTT